MKCKVDGCQSEIRTKGFCNKHYEQFRRHGDPLHKESKRRNKPGCIIDGCGRTTIAHGLCDKHYQKLRAHGSPTFSVRSPRGAAIRHPLYRMWCGMRKRCTDSGDDSYQNYGGRGISVCDRWGDFWNFVDDMGGRPSLHHSLDRINGDGNYEPANVRWATPKEQSRNRRTSAISDEQRGIIDARKRIGGRFSLRQFCKEHGIQYAASLRYVQGQCYAPDTVDHADVAPTPVIDFSRKPPLPDKCSIEGCGAVMYGKGYCRLHYRRAYESKTLSDVADIRAQRPCLHCEQIIPDSARPDQKYCSRSCALKHYRREGCYTQEAQLISRGACSVDGCGRPQHAQTLCRTHYMKKWHAEQKPKENPG